MRARIAVCVGLCLVIMSSPPLARERLNDKHVHVVVTDARVPESDRPAARGDLFAVAEAGTTWLGADPTGTSVVVGGVWDFDNRGTIACSADPNDTTVYLKNGAFAQGWTSEDWFGQKGVYFHAEDFSDPGFSCSRGPIAGNYSAWCGQVSRAPDECFVDPPGYGHFWTQWLCGTATLSASDNSLRYTFRSNTEPDFDYVYVIMDTMVTTLECGYLTEDVGLGDPDTLRLYTGNVTPSSDLTEVVDLSNPADWDDNVSREAGFYDGRAVRISFVVVSDGGWDDADGLYTTCDGAFAVDDIVITTGAGPDTTDLETGTLEGWSSAPGESPAGGDFVAVRDVSYFVNRDDCGFDNCEIAGCALSFFNPDIPGQYGVGGHHGPELNNVAWSPAIDLTTVPDGWGFVAHYDRYADLPIANSVFYYHYVKYVQDPNCPTGGWSRRVRDQHGYYAPVPRCTGIYWDFTGLVPNDADSIKIGIGTFQFCYIWAVPCTQGNETPFFDNVRVGVYGDARAPRASLSSSENFCDAFPEDGTCDSTSTARIDAAYNLGGRYFLMLGDSLVAQLTDDQARLDFCFKVIPGPGTDLYDPYFTTLFPGTYVPCDTSGVVNPFHSARMDTAFLGGNGVDPVTQFVRTGSYASLLHEEDPRSGGIEGIEILPDSLFTPGTKIFYYIKSSFEGSGYSVTVPYGATEDDLSTLFEIEILPDLCKNPPACLIYFDYFNRGAQAPIEGALTELGRTWDRYDLRAETSQEGNGIGNRFLGEGKYALRGFIGPSLAQLGHYNVLFVDNGTLGANTNFSDGGVQMAGDPTNDIAAMEAYLTEGPSRGLWLSGNSIAADFNGAQGSPKQPFLSDILGAVLDSGNYRNFSGHDTGERCRDLNPHYGEAASDNYFSVSDMLGLYGSGCPTRYDYDVIHKDTLAVGIVGNALLYDRSDLPGQSLGGPAYASVYHVFPTGAGTDSARTVIDGFSLHLLRDPACWTNWGIRDWTRDLLGNPGPSGVIAPGFFTLRPSGELLCPPVGEELVGGEGPLPPRYSYRLDQNYPNPFRSHTTIGFSTRTACNVEVMIFDVAGRLVKTITKLSAPGEGTVVWDGTDSHGRALASGVYFYQVRAGGFVGKKRMILAK